MLVNNTILFNDYYNKVIYKFQGMCFSREEECRKIHLAYEDLSRQLRDLPDLPLQIVSVHCISPVYR